ncbi:hypothetical protein EEDFHM_04620 [Methylorubrum populi]
MGERAFNAYLSGEVAVSAEGVTANFDRIAAPSLKKVLENKTLSSLGKHECAAIILFVALQINRGTGARNRSEDLWRQIERLLVSRFGQENVPSNLLPPENEDEKKHFHINFAIDSINNIALLLSEKDWILMEAPEGSEFVLGDNPVSLHNSRPADAFYGNLGLSSPGIEIYIPINPKYVLALMCTSIKDSFISSIRDLDATIRKLRGARVIARPPMWSGIDNALNKANQLLARSRQFLSAIECGTPLIITPDNVLHQNSLQVSHAERYIACKSGEFQTVKAMLNTNPHWKSGVRWQVG